MRISTQQAFGNSLNSLQDIYSDLLRTQEQISTGKRVINPSDDPIAATRILNLQQDNALISRYRDNITLATNNISEQESLLDSTLVAVQRLEELTIQAGDGALSNQDRIAIAQETQEIYEQLISIGNSQNARGEYLFAGSQAEQKPYVVQPDGTVIYQGDEAEREVEIAGGSFVSIRDSGFDIFEDIANKHRITTSTNSANGYHINSGELVDENAFDDFYDSFVGVPVPQTTTLTLTDNRDATSADFPNVPVDFSVSYTLPDGTGPITTNNVNYINLDTAADDRYLEVQVDMTAEMGQVFSLYLPVNEDGIVAGAGDADGTGGGDGEQTEFYIDRQETQSLMGIAYELTQILQEPGEASANNKNLSSRLGAVLDNLDNAGRNIDSVSASIGARLNLVDSTDALHEESEIFNASALASIEDVDFAEALSNLTLQETILEAAQASFVRVSNLSLFDRLG
ncbi:flagellar hook-associated protein FlgL [Halioxenophilus aromaticivorans]|uniref:Flagellar hook-associated protein FlgL n=1 Tax=Halioxenophilus aromaticivorans TaxID=1306992 RepID=A0AAV3U0H8_9ALTE